MDSILVIEDDKIVRDNIVELLNLAGYQLTEASNGKEGLDIAKKIKPNLILCDINLPELDGYAVLKAIENIPDLSAVPFVFITGQSETHHFRKAMDQGADDYLVKPFDGNDLLRLVSLRLKKAEFLKQKTSGIAEKINELILDEKNPIKIDLITDKKIIKRFSKKDIIFYEGDTPKFLYLLNSGSVKTFKTNAEGKEYITDLIKPGDYFGYMCLFDHNEHQESATAVEDSEVTMIAKQDFYHFLFSHTNEAIKLTRLISEKLSNAEEKLLKMAYNSARKRVAEALVFMAERYNKDEKDNFYKISRDNISAIAGIAPETVSRNLSDFREEGLIETVNGGLKIISLVKLKNIKN
ncbi:MAG: Regulator of RpoS [Bacteroidia bacterium]|nr:Regulator of RpoS [Bacteroidia bacterium]